MDFGASKCFGGAVDLHLQLDAGQRLLDDSLRPAQCCQVVFELVREAEVRAIETARQEQIANEQRTIQNAKEQQRLLEEGMIRFFTQDWLIITLCILFPLIAVPVIWYKNKFTLRTRIILAIWAATPFFFMILAFLLS